MNTALGAFAGLVFLLAVAVLVLVAITYRNKSGKKSSGGGKNTSKNLAAYDSRTDVFSEFEIVSGGPSGATGLADSGFFTVLSTTIKTCDDSVNTLFCDVSAQTAVAIVETDDNATGTAVVSSTSGELAAISIRVLVDGFPAAPGTVVFDDITHVIVTNLLPGDFRNELLALLSSNSFHFVSQNVPAGNHSIVVQARLQATAFAINELVSSALASIGARTLVVQPAWVKP